MERSARSDGQPLWGGRIWAEVTQRAGGQCECRKAACGNRHTRMAGPPKRCGRKLANGHRLFVVGPPGLSDTQLAQLGTGHLSAYCEDCASGIARLAGHGKRKPKDGPMDGQADILTELEGP